MCRGVASPSAGAENHGQPVWAHTPTADAYSTQQGTSKLTFRRQRRQCFLHCITEPACGAALASVFCSWYTGVDGD